MGHIERTDRPKPWRARYRAHDGRRISKSFRRKADAEKWLLLEEGDMLAGRWHGPESGTELFSDYCEKWMEQSQLARFTVWEYAAPMTALKVCGRW